MKKMIIALFLILSIMSFQQAGAQEKRHVKKSYTASPGYYRTPPRKIVVYRRAYPLRHYGNPPRHYGNPPYGRAVGYKGRNPNRARGKYKH